MEKLFLALWVILGSLVGAHHHSTALPAPHGFASPLMATPTASLTIFSTYHFPTAPTEAIDTSNWVTYGDIDDGVAFKYPAGWEYHTPPSAGPAVVTFKPAQTKLQDMGGNEYCIEATLLVNDYQTELQRLPIPFDGKFEIGPISFGNLSGVHLRDETSGRYLLNKDGKAIEFSYLIINGRDYGQEAEQMAQSLVFLRR